MKHRKSIQFQLTAFGFGIMTAAVLVIFLMNRLFLERYYISQKSEALYSAYLKLNDAALLDDITSDEFDAELVRIMSTDNLEVVVMSEGSRIVKYYAVDPQVLMHRMWDNLLSGTDGFRSRTQNVEDPSSADSKDNYSAVRTLSDVHGQSAQVVRDNTSGTQYIEMWGSLNGGSFYLMRTALESIQQNSRIAGRFILYVGLVVILLGAVISFLMSRALSRPIRQITQISERMKELDFSAKYSGQDRNELYDLGTNINELSSILERTISELKTANAQLRQDLARRDQNEQMQREFISNVTHELKTPIALIQGYAEALQEGVSEDPEENRYYTSVIIDESGRMNDMVQKLLTLNHLEFGGSEVVMERFDLMELLRGLTASSRILLEEEEIQLNMTPAEGSINVWSDPSMVEDVFRNYLSNAIHYCAVNRDFDRKLIDIRCEERGHKVRVHVFNSGEPVREDVIDRIWDKFYKADKARTRQYGGSGVGLSIVKAIMEQLGQEYGLINYENGVSFWFELERA